MKLVCSFLQPVYHLFCKLEQHFSFSNLPFSNLFTAQKMRFSIKDSFRKCDFLRIWSHLLKKSLMENFIFCAVLVKKTDVKDLSVLRDSEEGSLLECSITVYWGAKNLLNNSAFSLKFVISLFWQKREGIQGILFLFKNVSVIDSNSLNWFQDSQVYLIGGHNTYFSNFC